MHFLSQKLPFIASMTNTNFIFKFTLLPYCKEKKQKIHYSKMVHPRKISFTESMGSNRFGNNKVVSDFEFGHFLKKLT